MAKKIAPNPVEDVPGVIEDINNLSPADIDKLNIHLADIDLKYGDGLDYNKDRVIGEAKTYLQQTAEAMFETGKRLTLLREHEPHGEFMKSLENIGIEYRTAKNMMSATDKLLDENGNAKLKSISTLAITKLYSLAQLDDEDIEQLSENGEIEGFSIEEAQKLSTRELRSRIQELKRRNKLLEEEHQKQIETKEQLLADKNRKIDELDGQLRVMTDPSRWQEKAEKILINLHTLTPSFSSLIGEFSHLVREISDMDVKDWEQSQAILLDQAKYALHSLSEDLDRIDEQLRFASPQANAVFHEMTALKNSFAGEKAELEI